MLQDGSIQKNLYHLSLRTAVYNYVTFAPDTGRIRICVSSLQGGSEAGDSSLAPCPFRPLHLQGGPLNAIGLHVVTGNQTIQISW